MALLSTGCASLTPPPSQGMNLRIDAELAAATRLSNTASQVDDPDMQLALLRLVGPRIEATRLFRKMRQLQGMMEPAMTALASLEPGQVEAAATDLPALMGHLTGEFAATREAVRMAAERFEKMLRVKELIETLTTASAMKMALPRR